ncbi:Uncharacterised protein [Legionella busanensis]|uniref:Uncharacterized protein n=1 Tax=Legionella busanensis TaxID=190655 RepID=A0A378KDI5_9GAMM|nr:hypothetical protein [Legionella busanensis]STX81282.1 Uncharacterised protein [Legionella busanensis]
MVNIAINETLDQKLEDEKKDLFATASDNPLRNFYSLSTEDSQLKVFNVKQAEVNSTSLISEEVEVLHSIKAVIYEVLEDNFKLKIGEDTFINIPNSVFPDKLGIIKYGQNIIYSIKKRSNGRRFQDIEIDYEASENPYKNRVLQVLENIPYKDES